MGTQVQHITIVGGGLAGCLLANMLGRIGYKVTVFEYRQDPRLDGGSAHRSINLALSARGLHALARVNLDKEVLAHAKEMKGRCVHTLEKEPMFQEYGINITHVNYAIERAQLHLILVNALANNKNVQLHFNHKVDDWDPNTGELSMTLPSGERKAVQTELVIGADGAHSAIRRIMVEKAQLPFTEEIMSHGYKELIIPAEQGRALDLHWLHIWPRESFMLIALPNDNNSFTCTLFLANQGDVSFAQLQDIAHVNAFFKQYFPDVVPLIPNLAKEFLANPLGHIPSVSGYPWHVRSSGCLIGDAAHAIMPFYGQGMNCAFEDCEHLADLIVHYKKNWDKAFLSFERGRKPNTDAIAQMSMENYQQMRDQVTHPDYIRRREIERYLMQRFPREFVNQYAMVSFEVVPYAFVKACGELQNKLINRLMSEIKELSDLDNIPHLDDRIHSYARAVMDLKMSFM